MNAAFQKLRRKVAMRLYRVGDALERHADRLERRNERIKRERKERRAV